MTHIVQSRTISKRILWRLRKVALARPAPGAPKPLVVAGFFRTASGIGESARVCVKGLMRHGFEPVCVDISDIFGQRDVECDFNLQPMPDAARGTLILHANAPETERALFELDMFRNRNWRIIGYWAWELSDAPPDWLPATRYLSELWTPSRFVAGAFKGQSKIPVKVVPHYIEPAPKEVVQDQRISDAREAVLCLAMGDGRSSFSRKNLRAAVTVFREAAGEREDCALIVKTRNLGEFPDYERALRADIGEDERIRIVDGPYSKTEQDALISSVDIFVSLHRSEGFGLVLAEAMAHGVAVVATDWSGSIDFLDSVTGMPVEYSLTPVEDDCGVYTGYAEKARWAEPDFDDAVKALRHLIDEPDFRRALGAAARNRVAERLDGSAYAEALRPDCRRGDPGGG